MNKNNYVAIMAGGIGSRFWPVSKPSLPKQFLDILHTGKTLLQATYDRYLQFIPNENIYIVTNHEYVPLAQAQLPNLPKENIIGESERKNTAPCVAYISFKLNALNPNANLIIAPSDHLITDTTGFKSICENALEFTSNNEVLLTLGMQPSHPNTGYGYIQYNKNAIESNVHSVIRFAEKPNLADAVNYLASGEYLWNAGIFIWTTKEILKALANYTPELYTQFKRAEENYNTSNEQNVLSEIYKTCASISIDYAVMEHAKNIVVIPAQFGWSDLGTWNSVWEQLEKDDALNAITGTKTLTIETKNCLVHSNENKLVLVAGVEDLIVVNTPDAVLICKREDEQKIKEFSEQAEAFISNKTS